MALRVLNYITNFYMDFLVQKTSGLSNRFVQWKYALDCSCQRFGVN